jgi:hypothetical protein
VSSPEPEQAEVAALLLSRAADDLRAARALAPDAHQAEHVIGFLTQWAVTWRYDDPVDGLERTAAIDTPSAVVEWARSIIAS